MDTALNSPPHDSGGDTTAAFRKPSNDGASRMYRRRALADDGSSSSDGSPERNQSPNPKHSRGDIRKFSESGHARKDDRRESDRSRYGRGGGDSHRHDRYSRDVTHGSKYDDHYNRHERDVPRSSRDSRGGHHHSDRRRVETEHSRSRNDSERHSRDKYSNSGHRNNIEKGEEKDYVRGRESQDEKRGSRWGFGDRQSRDERKEREDTEINKEKDVHVKSPRDRSDGKCLATENREIHSKKLKGFVSEKFTHGHTNEEKHTSSIKPASGTGNQDLTVQSQSKEAQASSNVDAAKVAAMQAAELVNKNLVGTGYLTTDQKKKLLWGKKKSTATEEPPAHRWDSALIGDRERQEKFNKLMSLRLRWCIIVGCEREYSKAREEPERSRVGETERVAAGSREAVHCRIEEERRTHSGVRSLMNKPLW